MQLRTACFLFAIAIGTVLCATGCRRGEKSEVEEKAAPRAQAEAGSPTPDPLATFDPADRALLTTLILITEADPDEGTVPLEVQFEVEADEPLVKPVYQWNFGDGSPISNEASPKHVFKKPGLYTVTVNIHDEETGFSGDDTVLVDAEEPEDGGVV